MGNEELVCLECSQEINTDYTYGIESSEEGLCLDCNSNYAFCEKHEDYVSVIDGYDYDSRICKDCVQEYFSGPETDDPDFFDSYDPDFD
ncbi:hypothetical protein [Solibacillus sp. FSL K6-1523]|uniref:hypothetical protein n=1 Tax=Solibacillus sp. FSL K6-1523 TaxID=2921471 RepID=UPI0030F73B2E